MDNISDSAAMEVDYANELVNPFFTRAQVYAFTIPPSPSVVSTVNKGGQQDYIPHEYIRTLLDRYIGTGRWEMQGTLHSTDKEIVKKYDSREKKQIEQVAATANVNVTLTIHAQDGSDRTLVYSAVGSNTQYAAVEKGYGAIIGNAIGSAESLGLKRAATNLGRAFGFDLKSKVKATDLPPNLSDIAAQINQYEAERRAKQLSSQAPSERLLTQAPTDEAQAADERQASQTNSQSAPATQEQQLRRPSQSEQKPQARERSVREPSQEVHPQQKDNRQNNDGNVTAFPTNRTSPASQTAANDAPQATATAQTPADEDWELSLMPAKFEEWLKCIKTMARRINAMTSGREIENFARRHAKLIGKLPIIPGEEGKADRNFKLRWQTIVRKRYTELDLEVPAEYAEAA